MAADRRRTGGNLAGEEGLAIHLRPEDHGRRLEASPAGKRFQADQAGHARAAPASATAHGVIRIKAGSSTPFKDSAGNVWEAERGFEGGQVIERAELEIANTKEPGLYRSEHYSMDSFSCDVPNGKYVVKLHFAETFEGISGEGQRVFSFKVQGHEFKDFDVWKKAGGANRAYVETVPVEVTDGKLKIIFTSNIENPQINAIEIVAQTTPTPATPAPAKDQGVIRIKAGSSAFSPEASRRRRVLLDSNWRFYRGEVPGSPTASQGTPITRWRWIVADDKPNAAKMAAPGLDTSGGGWKDAATGDDVFHGRVGSAWFRTALPEGKGSGYVLHFEGVNDNATVYLNGRRLGHHEGWNDPFDVDLAPAWKETGVNELAILVENTAGAGGITAPVSLEHAEAGVVTGPAGKDYDDHAWRSRPFAARLHC